MSDIAASPVALVTGGANGIGAALCRTLADRGFRVVVADLDADRSRSIADEIGGSAVAVDVSDPEQNAAMVAHALTEYGRLDAVALNAGIASSQDASSPLSVAHYRRLVGVNIDGVVFGIDAAVPALSVHGGSILVTASIAGLGPRGNPLYGLTKSAVVGYVRGMAPPLAQRGVRINAVCPGLVDTAILSDVNRKFLLHQKFPLLSPDEVALAAMEVLRGDGTGEVWTVMAGQPPARHEFTPPPSTKDADGNEAVLRRFRPSQST